jgi:hypothetical protein
MDFALASCNIITLSIPLLHCPRTTGVVIVIIVIRIAVAAATAVRASATVERNKLWNVRNERRIRFLFQVSP